MTDKRTRDEMRNAGAIAMFDKPIPMADFLDVEEIPLSPAEQRQRMLERLDELPPDMRDFILNPTNTLYLRIAMLASSLNADQLRKIAETLLDITY